MIFVYKKWDAFCKALSESKIKSIRVADCFDVKDEPFLVLKHDVETDVNRAYELAKIEMRYGHLGTFYVQAYLLDQPENIRMLKEIQAMGHEVSYHYDVLDSCKGDLEKAISEFRTNVAKFREHGFEVKTLCQHGNPIVERVGYHSNRDFFRSEKVQALFGEMCDVMVDLKDKAQIDYDYYSDAGRKFKFIFDPITNDISPSDEKNISYDNLSVLHEVLVSAQKNAIISTHPHRWTNSAAVYVIKAGLFKLIKAVAKLLLKIPFMKKFMSRYYYLAKKV